MDFIVVDGVPPYDGRWELDLEGRELTTREWGWIKRLAGYLPLQLDEAAMGDPELLTVLAVVALRRAGKVEAPQAQQVFDRLQDAPFGTSITMETDVEEAEGDDAGPPVRSSNGSAASSGAASTTSSETSPGRPSLSGTPGSDTLVSVPERSGS